MKILFEKKLMNALEGTAFFIYLPTTFGHDIGDVLSSFLANRKRKFDYFKLCIGSSCILTRGSNYNPVMLFRTISFYVKNKWFRKWNNDPWLCSPRIDANMERLIVFIYDFSTQYPYCKQICKQHIVHNNVREL